MKEKGREIRGLFYWNFEGSLWRRVSFAEYALKPGLEIQQENVVSNFAELAVVFVDSVFFVHDAVVELKFDVLADVVIDSNRQDFGIEDVETAFGIHEVVEEEVLHGFVTRGYFNVSQRGPQFFPAR